MNNAETGLRLEDFKIILEVINRFPEVEEAIIFGSRALGNYKTGSDIDLALKGNVDKIYLSIKSILNEETTLPYNFDVLNYNNITNPNLKIHIDTFGKVIFKKENGITNK